MRLPRLTTSISGLVAAGTSAVCIASMGAMAAVSTAGAMAGMGVTATARAPALTQALRAVGLGGLTHLPNAVLQPLLIILLLVAVAAALWHAHSARTWPTVSLALLTVLAVAGLYASIYVRVSEGGYWVALTVLLLASMSLPWASRRRRARRVA